MKRMTLLFLLIAGGLSLVLFSAKYRVQDLEDELVALNADIVADRQAVHVLKAEWSLLNEPKRLQRLAEDHLGMVPMEPARITDLSNIPTRAKAQTVRRQKARADYGDVAKTLSGLKVR